MNRTRLAGLALTAAGAAAWIATQVPGYERQVLAAIVSMGLAVAAIAALNRSLDGVAGGG